MKTASTMLATALALYLVAPVSHGLVIVGGAQKLEDRGWPSGALALINLDSRFRFVEGPPFGGGQYYFEYRGDAAAFNQALLLFAQISAPGLELVVRTGPGGMVAATEDETDLVDWRLTIWVPNSFNELYRNPDRLAFADDPNAGGDMPAPQVELYVGSHSSIKFEEVVVPANVRVRDFRREQGSILRGVVYDVLTGRPVSSAIIELTRYDSDHAQDAPVIARTDARGEYAVEDLPFGGYSVVVSSIGYAPRWEASFVSREHEFRETTTYLSPRTDVSGVVVDREGVPIEGVRIAAHEVIGLDGHEYPFTRGTAWPSAETDAEGRFTISGLPQGEVRLACADDWYSDSILTPYRTDDPDIRIVADVRGTVQVTLLDTSGRPFDGEVGIQCQGERGYSWNGSATFVNGVWEWSQVPPDVYYFVVRREGHFPEEDPSRVFFTLDPGGIAHVTVRMPAAK